MPISKLKMGENTYNEYSIDDANIIRFRLSNHDYIDCEIRDGQLHIKTMSSVGNGFMNITPQSSNVIRVEVL